MACELGGNRVTFGHQKSEAVLFSRKRSEIWLDPPGPERSTENGDEEGTECLDKLRRLTGKMGLTLVNCREVVVASVQSVAMYGNELWWRGEGKQGIAGGAAELQKLVNQEARNVTGCFRKPIWEPFRWSRVCGQQLENRQNETERALRSSPMGRGLTAGRQGTR